MLDLVVRNGSVVFPGQQVVKADIGITDEKISHIGNNLEGYSAEKEIDASGKLVFPGIIDSHFHVGIYRPLSDDARSESMSAAAGGVTTILSYFRTGRNYLNSSAPYMELYREVLRLSAGNFYTDYGFHLAPVTRTHVQEIPQLVEEHGVSTFKYYMFYRGLVLKGEFRKGAVEKEYLLSDDPYDLGHLKNMMQQIASVSKGISPVRLSIHAEDAELIRIYLEKVRRDEDALKKKDEKEGGKDRSNPIRAYSAARPPESERLALVQAVELARQTGCPINILHVSSRLALDTVSELRSSNPSLDIMAETTLHHLMLNETYNPSVDGKVNPPIRTADDNDALWEGVRRNVIDTVASDHACLTKAQKGDDLWTAEPGFAGTELILPALLTEGHYRRGIPLEHLAALVTLNPAAFHGLSGRKGNIGIGMDADIAICNPSTQRKVAHSELHSAQDFSPFDGLELRGWVETTVLRGNIIYQDGKVVGGREGKYLKRPLLKTENTRK